MHAWDVTDWFGNVYTLGPTKLASYITLYLRGIMIMYNKVNGEIGHRLGCQNYQFFVRERHMNWANQASKVTS